MRPFDWCQNKRPWMTLNGRYALYCRKDASFGAHHKQVGQLIADGPRDVHVIITLYRH